MLPRSIKNTRPSEATQQQHIRQQRCQQQHVRISLLGPYKRALYLDTGFASVPHSIPPTSTLTLPPSMTHTTYTTKRQLHPPLPKSAPSRRAPFLYGGTPTACPLQHQLAEPSSLAMQCVAHTTACCAISDPASLPANTVSFFSSLLHPTILCSPLPMRLLGAAASLRDILALLSDWLCWQLG